MNRKFGVELEMVGISREQAVQALRLVGVSVQAEGYNHTIRCHWKIVPDSSVRGGFEVVSPVLQGEEGLEQLRAVTTALDDMGGSVNRTCGFHVHFDAADLSVDHIRTIVTRYAAHEAEIDAFMPPSRRGNTNSYCRSVIELAQSASFRNATTLRELVEAQSGRYFKVNLKSHHVHGTVEFRQHSGTLNAPKAVNWVRLLDAFITECKSRVDAPAVQVAVPSLQGVSGQLAAMFFESAEGVVTLEAMCQRFDWQVHSARAAVTRLRQAGMHIVYDRAIGYQVRSAAVAQPVTSGSLFDGVAEFLQIFYRNRAAVLSAA